MRRNIAEKSKGWLIGIIGLAVFIICLLMPIYTSELFRGNNILISFLIMCILSIMGFIISIRDYRKGKKLSLTGIIVNSIFLFIIILLVLSFVVLLFYPSEPRPYCFDSIDNIYIDAASEYTCYYIVDPDPGVIGDEYAVLNVSVQRGAKAVDIRNFFITVYGNGTSEKYEISPGAHDQITMYDGNNILEIPGRREMRTYIIKTNLPVITSADLSPIIKGNIACDAASKGTIEMCG